MRFPSFNTNYSMGNAPEKWPVDVFTESNVHYHTVYPSEDLQYYGRRIPWAGWIILRIDEQAKSHPRVIHVFQLVKPRWRGGHTSSMPTGNRSFPR